MKKNLVLGLLLTLITFSFSLGQIISKDPDWKDGEKFAYEIRYKGELVGSSDYLITDTLVEKNKAYSIKVATLTGYLGQNTFDSVSLIVDHVNLKPQNLVRATITPQIIMMVKARYLEDKVRIRLDTPLETKETEMDFPKDGYDNEEMLLLLRALTLKEGEKFSFTNIYPSMGKSNPVEIEVLKPEKVVVPSGEYLCNKVKMKIAGKEVELYYQKEKPNLMVKYVDNEAGTEMLLKEYKIEGKEKSKK